MAIKKKRLFKGNILERITNTIKEQGLAIVVNLIGELFINFGEMLQDSTDDQEEEDENTAKA